MKPREARKREARDQGLWMLGGVAALLVVYMWIERRWLTSWYLTSCGLGYVISVLGGIPVTYAWSEFLFWLLEKYVRAPNEPSAGHERIWWIAMMVGAFERALITSLVAYNVSGGGSFIAAWVALKMVIGWQRWEPKTRYARAAAFMALLGNAMSILLGLGGGIICREALGD